MVLWTLITSHLTEWYGARKTHSMYHSLILASCRQHGHQSIPTGLYLLVTICNYFPSFIPITSHKNLPGTLLSM